MFNIHFIDFNEDIYKKLLKTSLDKPRKTRTNVYPHYDDVISNINSYLSNIPNFERINSLFYSIAKVHDELYELYDSTSTDVETLKNNIKELTIRNPKTKEGLICSYCGITRSVIHDLDHFLPRSKYPEFSILSNNLIYVCPTCNQDYKKNEFLDTSTPPIRKFLNPYYDSLDEDEIIKCNISNNGVILNIEYIANPNLAAINPYLYKVTKNHLKSLNLNERYIKIIQKDLIDKFLNKFKDKDIKTHRQIRNFTNSEAQTFINDKIDELDDSLKNNFELLFWKEFLNCTNYFNSIKGQQL
jgi:5-methylcytosine-specific restriction endonuclease McrA